MIDGMLPPVSLLVLLNYTRGGLHPPPCARKYGRLTLSVFKGYPSPAPAVVRVVPCPLQGLMHLLDAVLSREYALYRSLCYFQREGRRCAGDSEVATTAAVLYPRGNSHVAKGQVWRAKDWMGIVPGWVWEELQKGQWDERQVRKLMSQGSRKVGRCDVTAWQVRMKTYFLAT